MLSHRVIFLALLVTACAAAPNEPPEPWRVSVTTDGGFAGRGIGAFAIASDGTVEITNMSGQKCSYRASEAELQRFRELLAKARPRQWAPSYVPEERCCDRIHYAMKLEAGTITEVTWIDQPLPMPADLAALADAMVGGAGSVRVTSDERCRAQAR